MMARCVVDQISDCHESSLGNSWHCSAANSGQQYQKQAHPAIKDHYDSVRGGYAQSARFVCEWKSAKMQI